MNGGTSIYFYVKIGGENPYIHRMGEWYRKVQGSTLGPILNALFVSPLFDLAKMTLFADDNYVLHRNKQLPTLLQVMETTITTIIKWLKQSGLKNTDAKTEICLFDREDNPPVKLKKWQ